MIIPDDDKDKVYQELDTLTSSIPRGNKLYILGDFNARIVNNHQTWSSVIGSNDMGKCNSNGLLLLHACITNNLFFINNTVSCQANHNKTTSIYPRSKHRHFIDYVITRKADRHDVLITKVMNKFPLLTCPRPLTLSAGGYLENYGQILML